MPSGFNANYNTVAVGATAVVICAGKGRSSLIIQNLHASQILYVGDDSGVLTTTGLRIAAGEAREFRGFTGTMYGIASGASTDTRFFEVA